MELARASLQGVELPAEVEAFVRRVQADPQEPPPPTASDANESTTGCFVLQLKRLAGGIPTPGTHAAMDWTAPRTRARGRGLWPSATTSCAWLRWQLGR